MISSFLSMFKSPAPSMTSTANGIVFAFDNSIGKTNPDPIKTNNLNNPTVWPMILFNERARACDNRQDVCMITNAKEYNTMFKLLPDSVFLPCVHVSLRGFIQNVDYAWRQETGLEIRPEVLFHLFCSEINKQVIKNSDKYCSLFTTSSDKKDIVMNPFSLEALIQKLSDLMPNKELVDVVCNTTFTTAPEIFPNVMAITMASMSSPYYDYISSLCGIPKIRIAGSRNDWDKIVQSVDRLAKIFAAYPEMILYCTTVKEVVSSIIKSVFVDRDGKYLANIYTREKNNVCMSGHDEVLMNGWAQQLYFGKYNARENKFHYKNSIDDYSSHINYMVYRMEEDPSNIKYRAYVTGLTSSVIKDGFLVPGFSVGHYEIDHPHANKVYGILNN